MDMMADINLEGEHDEKKMVENQVHKLPEKRDMMIDINPEGEYDEEKTLKKQPYEKPEKRDVVADINPEGKYDEEEVVEKQLVATEDAPRLRREESMTEDWKMKAEICFAQSDVLNDAKEAIEINKEDVVRQDFVLISSKVKNKELDLWAEKSFGENDKDDDARETAETKGGTSAEQKKSFADEEEVKMILVRKKIRKTGRKMMRMLHKHLEDAEEKGSRGSDAKSVPEVEMERSEDEAEEEADDDDLGEDNRAHFIKGDGSKDDSEDTADEEMIKQDEAPKNREIIKKEPASAMVITDATGMKTEIKEGAREDTVEVDKDETNKEDMMKQDKALFNRENAHEVRTESQRKLNSRHSKSWTLRELMTLLMLLMLQVDVVTARDNLG
jgi:hypothetical protein